MSRATARTAPLLAAALGGCAPSLAPEGLRIEQIGPLSFAVRTETTEPALIELVYWPEDPTVDPQAPYFQSEAGEPRTEHALELLGLRAGLPYALRVRILDARGEALETLGAEVRTDDMLPLPSGLPDWAEALELRTQVYCPRPELRSLRTTFLTNLLLTDANPFAEAVVWDRFGYPIWTHVASERVLGSTGDIVVRLLGDPEGGYLDGNRARSVLIAGAVPAGSRPVEVGFDHSLRWSGPVQAELLGEAGYQHHASTRTADGLTLTTTTWREGPGGEPTDWLVLHDERFDPVGAADLEEGVVWEARLDEVQPGSTYFGNSTTRDAEAGIVYHHDHASGVLMAISEASGRPLWAFGRQAGAMSWDEQVVLIDAIAESHGIEDPWFGDAHDLEVEPDPDAPDRAVRVLVHDNGGAEPGYERGFTRAMEYRLDLAEARAELLWAYPARRPEASSDPDAPLAYCNQRFGGIARVGENAVLFSGGAGGEGCGGLAAKTVIQELRPDLESHDALLVWRMIVEPGPGAEEPLFPAFYGGEPVRDLRGRLYDVDPMFANDGAWVTSRWSNLTRWGETGDAG